METICVKLGFIRLFVVDPVGRSGGLALLWHEDSGLIIHNFSRRHIHAEIPHNQGGSWSLIGFYGHPIVAKRYESWALLEHLEGKFYNETKEKFTIPNCFSPHLPKNFH